MTINVTNIDKEEAWSGDVMLDVGNHTVKIEEAEEGQSSQGNDEVKMKFITPDGGAGIRDWLQFTEKTMGKVRQLLDAVGIEPEGGEWAFPTEKLVGKTLDIYVGEENDRDDPGKKRKKVKAYKPASSGSNGTGKSDDDLPF